MSNPDEVILTPTLAIEAGRWPAGLDAPDGAVVMIRKRHGGQVTLSQGDWDALRNWIRSCPEGRS